LPRFVRQLADGLWGFLFLVVWINVSMSAKKRTMESYALTFYRPPAGGHWAFSGKSLKVLKALKRKGYPKNLR